MEERRLLTVDDCARRLGIGRSHAYQYVLRGEIASVKLGRNRRVTPEALDAFIERLQTEQVED
jgi:excisionase family DNA binding protein